MTNEIATIPQPVLHPVTEQQANAWVSLAVKKNETLYQLELAELKYQGLLLPVQESNNHEEIDVALAEARKVYNDAILGRKDFTRIIDENIIQSMMAPEKRMDPKVNQLYLSASNRSLSLRKAKEAETAKINAKNQETAAFKIHVENEFLRSAATYRGKLIEMIEQAYKEWLKAGLKKPDFAGLEKVLVSITPPPVNKFQPVHLQHEDMQKIFDSCDKPNYNEIFKETDFIIKTKFANWDSDLANAEAAIKHAEEQAQLAAAEEKRRVEEEAAFTTLVTTAEAVTVEAPKIRRNVIVEEENTEAWFKAVVTTFITHLPHMDKYIRVKSWSKLSVGQMANYLGQYATDTGELFTGLILKEVEK